LRLWAPVYPPRKGVWGGWVGVGCFLCWGLGGVGGGVVCLGGGVVGVVGGVCCGWAFFLTWLAFLFSFFYPTIEFGPPSSLFFLTRLLLGTRVPVLMFFFFFPIFYCPSFLLLASPVFLTFLVHSSRTAHLFPSLLPVFPPSCFPSLSFCTRFL